MVKPGLLPDAAAARFRSERQILAGLRHPNIAQLLDGGVSDGVPYFILELVEGKHIDEYCNQNRLSMEQRFMLFRQVCDAVQYAHSKGIIHRDIKPGNILVSEEGVPKLLDFGIAKILQEGPEQAATRTADRMATPNYASPEQIAGQPITARSDVYSLGILFYELIAGRQPVRSAGRSSDQPWERPSAAARNSGITLPVRLWKALDLVIMKAIHKDAARRYLTVQDLSMDVQRLLEGKLVHARSDGIVYTARGFAGRQRMFLMGVLALVIGVTVSAASWWHWRRTASGAARTVGGPAPHRPAVALLDLRNLSGDAQTAWLAAALPEMIATELAASEKIRTVSRDDVVRMEHDLKLSGNIGKETLVRIHSILGAEYVVEGSYLAAGDAAKPDVRVDLRIEKALSGETIGTFSDTAAQAEILRLVSRAGAMLRGDLGVPNDSGSNPAVVRSLFPAGSDALRNYSEGLARLRLYDATGARAWLQKAAAGAPGNPLAHSALAQAEGALGYDTLARREAKRAFELSADLPREQRLFVEGLRWEAEQNWSKAIAIYQSLWESFPDNPQYGLRLAGAQTISGNSKAALDTVAAIRRIGGQAGSDARIDIAEASAAETVADYKRQMRAATDAAAKGAAAGARQMEAVAASMQAPALASQANLAEAQAAYEKSVRLFTEAGDRGGAARALNGLSVLHWRHGDFNESLAAANQALATAREIGNKTIEASAMNNIGVVARQRGDYAGARKTMLQVLAIYREAGNLDSQAVALANLGSASHAQRDMPAARKYYEEAITISREVGDKRVLATTLSNLSDLLNQQGDIAGAISAARQALELARQSGYSRTAGLALQNLGSALEVSGDLEGAKKAYQEALDVKRKLADKRGIAYAVAALGDVAFAEDDLAGARKGAEEALQIRIGLGDKHDAASSRLRLAAIARSDGRPAESEAQAHQLMAEGRAERNRPEELQGAVELALALLDENKAHQAEGVIRNAVSLSRREPDPSLRFAFELARARVYGAMRRTGEAAQIARSVLANAKTAGLVQLQMEARLDLARLEPAGCGRLLDFAREASEKHFAALAREARISAQAKSCPPVTH
jgi:tetratricopeptide (TPR) repeat protein/TolB-like protein